MYIVARLSSLAKNVPQRNRAGFRFNHEPSVADVDAKELAILRADPYIKICNFPSVAWFEAMGIERTQVNEDKFKDKDGNFVPVTKQNYKLLGTARLAVLTGLNKRMAQDGAEKPSTGDEGGSEGADTTQGANTSPDATGAATGDATGGDQTVQSKGLFGKTIELSASSPKEELIKALEKKRKKAGEDFNPESSPEALFALLRSL